MVTTMSEFNKRLSEQMRREIAEVETLRGKYQSILDNWWWDTRAVAEEERRLKRELDPYGLGIYDDDFHVIRR
jgi:hypothetical protein